MKLGGFARKNRGDSRTADGDFFVTVKTEEEPSFHGFSATRLGMERAIEREKK
jgi:hypothetical protein